MLQKSFINEKNVLTLQNATNATINVLVTIFLCDLSPISFVIPDKSLHSKTMNLLFSDKRENRMINWKKVYGFILLLITLGVCILVLRIFAFVIWKV